MVVAADADAIVWNIPPRTYTQITLALRLTPTAAGLAAAGGLYWRAGHACGLGISTVGAGKVGYTWDDLQYDWDSGITHTIGWPQVWAVSIHPGRADLLVDGKIVTHTVSHNAQQFGDLSNNLLIGKDKVLTNRYLTAYYELAAVWDRALSREELQWLNAEPYAFIAPPAPRVFYQGFDTIIVVTPVAGTASGGSASGSGTNEATATLEGFANGGAASGGSGFAQSVCSASGGTASGGAGTCSVGCVASGGAACGGSATCAASQQCFASGGSASGGSCTATGGSTVIPPLSGSPQFYYHAAPISERHKTVCYVHLTLKHRSKLRLEGRCRAHIGNRAFADRTDRARLTTRNWRPDQPTVRHSHQMPVRVSNVNPDLLPMERRKLDDIEFWALLKL